MALMTGWLLKAGPTQSVLLFINNRVSATNGRKKEPKNGVGELDLRHRTPQEDERHGCKPDQVGAVRRGSPDVRFLKRFG